MAYFHNLFFLRLTDNHLKVWETLPWRDACYKRQSPRWATWHLWAPKTRIRNMKARASCWTKCTQGAVFLADSSFFILCIISKISTILSISTTLGDMTFSFIAWPSGHQIVPKHQKSQRMWRHMLGCGLHTLGSIRWPSALKQEGKKNWVKEEEVHFLLLIKRTKSNGLCRGGWVSYLHSVFHDILWALIITLGISPRLDWKQHRAGTLSYCILHS